MRTYRYCTKSLVRFAVQTRPSSLLRPLVAQCYSSSHSIHLYSTKLLGDFAMGSCGKTGINVAGLWMSGKVLTRTGPGTSGSRPGVGIGKRRRRRLEARFFLVLCLLCSLGANLPVVFLAVGHDNLAFLAGTRVDCFTVDVCSALISTVRRKRGSRRLQATGCWPSILPSNKPRIGGG